jgi:DNA mismatch repair ATPase MutL
VVFLFIEMPPSEYDVNVHPTKIEVRFCNSNLVHSQVLGTLRETLLGVDLHVPATIPAGEPAANDAADRLSRRQGIADAMAEFFKKHRPADMQQQFEAGIYLWSFRRDIHSVSSSPIAPANLE